MSRVWRVRPPVPLFPVEVTEEAEIVGQHTPRAPVRHKVGGFADWIQVDARMYAYFDSRVPFTDPEAVEALRRCGMDPEDAFRAQDRLRTVRELEARGVDAFVLGKASEDFELLLQVDSDRRADLNWGDVGRLYLFARESDVRVRRFDRVVGWVDYH
jgi:hypothetical protein